MKIETHKTGFFEARNFLKKVLKNCFLYEHYNGFFNNQFRKV
jgi:hypothetical protein